MFLCAARLTDGDGENRLQQFPAFRQKAIRRRTLVLEISIVVDLDDESVKRSFPFRIAIFMVPGTDTPVQLSEVHMAIFDLAAR